jgi:hypothetical protein
MKAIHAGGDLKCPGGFLEVSGILGLTLVTQGLDISIVRFHPIKNKLTIQDRGDLGSNATGADSLPIGNMLIKYNKLRYRR